MYNSLANARTILNVYILWLLRACRWYGPVPILSSLFITYVFKMKTRSKDTHLFILPESPGLEFLEITGSKLPSHRQVLLCFISKKDNSRLVDGTKA